VKTRHTWLFCVYVSLFCACIALFCVHKGLVSVSIGLVCRNILWKHAALLRRDCNLSATQSCNPQNVSKMRPSYTQKRPKSRQKRPVCRQKGCIYTQKRPFYPSTMERLMRNFLNGVFPKKHQGLKNFLLLHASWLR